MGKNKARHLLHGILDLLPLFVIPIFAIYTRNENYNSNIEVQVYENKVVDFNQYVGRYESYDRTTRGISVIYDNDNCTFTFSGTSTVQSGADLFSSNTYIDINDSHKVYFKFVDYYNRGVTTTLFLNNNYNNYITLGTNDPSTIKTCNDPLRMVYNYANGVTFDLYFELQIFDLTQMFGRGNEPTKAQFDLWYPNSFYNYTESKTEVIENYNNITYNDTDVGSQFVYTLYNTVDKYFNMGNVFNMNDVYDWFVLNIFGGNASISVYIVWNIVLYEFVMDLLFLLYGLFMFFIDMCKRLMEKPLNSIK